MSVEDNASLLTLAVARCFTCREAIGPGDVFSGHVLAGLGLDSFRAALWVGWHKSCADPWDSRPDRGQVDGYWGVWEPWMGVQDAHA